MKSVAAGDEIAGDLVADAVLEVGDARTIGVEIMRLDVCGFINGGQAGRLAGVHQVERHFGLAVDHHRLAGGGLHVDAMAAAAEREFDAVMDQAFAVRTRAGADLIEQRNGAFLEQAGADAAEHIVRGLALQDDVVDAVACSSCPSSNPAGPAPMIATFVRNTCPPDYYRLEVPVRTSPHFLQ